jgi:hypothetical protein
VKSDDFVLDFFAQNAGLSKTFAKEIQNKDIPALRKFFYSLYPIVGLEDPFLCGLFHQELASLDYRQIALQYDERVAQAIVHIEAVEDEGKFLEGLELIARELAAFGADMITQRSVQDALEEIINKEIHKNEE